MIPWTIPLQMGLDAWSNGIRSLLSKLRQQPRAFPNRISAPSGGSTMGLQLGSPHVPTQPLPVEAPDYQPEPLSLLAPPLQPLQPEQPATADYSTDWRKYFNDVYEQLRRRELPPVTELPMPIEPAQTDWQRMLPLALGLLTMPPAMRAGFVRGLAGEFLRQQQAQREYAQALAQRAYQMAEAERQRQIAQAQADAQARELALETAQAMAIDEERRKLQAQIESERLQQRAEQERNRAEQERNRADIQTALRYLSMSSNPYLSDEQRRAYHQNAADILLRQGIYVSPPPAAPSVPEQAQRLREVIEPTKLQAALRLIGLKEDEIKQRAQTEQGRLALAAQGLALARARLDQAIRQQNFRETATVLNALLQLYNILSDSEGAIDNQLFDWGQDEFGRSVPLYNISPERMAQLLSGGAPANATESQFLSLINKRNQVGTLRDELQGTILRALFSIAPQQQPSTPAARQPAQPARKPAQPQKPQQMPQKPQQMPQQQPLQGRTRSGVRWKVVQ